MVYRVYVEKKAGHTHEADGLLREVQDFLQIRYRICCILRKYLWTLTVPIIL